MACRGVHFAIEPDEALRLLAATSDDEVLELIQDEIEERWEEEWLVETDKSWDAIHRCLSDGTLDPGVGDDVRKLAVVGGRQLFRGEDYIVSLVTPEEVKEVAVALSEVTQDWFREKYDLIDTEDYGCPKSDADFEYTWNNFQSLVEFFGRMRNTGRYVFFSVDQ